MFRPRIIPVLLLKNQGLVKSVKFRNHRYIGDPINAVKIFNDLKADELIFLDIIASKANRTISLDFVKKVGEEANMPFSVGGGIKAIEDIKHIINAGAEKVILCNYAVKNPEFVKIAANNFGSSTIAVCIDVKKNIFGKETVFNLNGTKSSSYEPIHFAQLMANNGAGEIIIQSIENDGMMNGYNLKLVNQISKAVSIPVVALGGAGSVEHLRQCYKIGLASALAAGSMFVYQGTRKGILINYPNREYLTNYFI